MNDDNVVDTTDTHDVDKNFELAQGIVKDIIDNNPSAAMDKMNDTMMDRVRDAIAGKRQEVAQNLLGTEPQEDEVETEVEDTETDETTEPEEEVEVEAEAETEPEEEGEVEEVEEVTDEETEEEDEDVQAD